MAPMHFALVQIARLDHKPPVTLAFMLGAFGVLLSGLCSGAQKTLWITYP